MKAQEVLMDCKECYWDLKDALERNDQQQIRIKWITCLTFLRMVGHVLDKVDKRNYPIKCKVFDNFFEERKNDEIFRNFIDKERNMAIKEYEFMIVPDKHEVETEVGLLMENGSRFLTESGEYLLLEQSKKVNQFASKMNTNNSEKRLDTWIYLAINWWESYIKELSVRLNAT